MDVSLIGNNILFVSIAHDAEAEAKAHEALPKSTTSISIEYRHRLADTFSRASVSDRLVMLFEQDKDASITSITADLIYKACATRIERKVKAGAFIVEASDFAAMSCWEPPAAAPPLFRDEELDEIERDRPTFAQFVRDLQRAKVECLGPEQKYWSLSLMARDPDRKDKGAVRAVIEPWVVRAKMEPLWLVAANARARDVYVYFGFRVVKLIVSYPRNRIADGNANDGEGVLSWAMVCNWPVERDGSIS